MLKNGLTIVILPERNRRVLRFKLPGWLILGGVILLGGLGLAGGYGLFQTARLQSTVAGYEQLRSSHLAQEVELRKVANQVEDFKQEIARLREMDYKLRLITDLDVDQPSPAIYGIGGFVDPAEGGLTSEDKLDDMDLLALLNKDLGRLEKMTTYQEESFNTLKSFLMDRKDFTVRTPYRWPVRGFISSTFGPRTDPFTGQVRQHEGIDIVAPKGTVVKAPAEGIVTFAGVDASLGNMLVIDHGYGVITRYGHNNSLLVREGQRISRGDPIATVGSTGRSTGIHVHYEVRVNDVAINPLKFIIN